jgi:hypothetical protein
MAPKRIRDSKRDVANFERASEQRARLQGARRTSGHVHGRFPCLDARQERFALKRSECVRAPLSSLALSLKTPWRPNPRKSAKVTAAKSNRRFRRSRAPSPYIR